MSFNLIDIYRHMGLFALCIAWALAAMAVASLAVFFERLYVYARSRRASRRAAPHIASALKARDHEGVVREAQLARGSHLATLIGAGVEAYLDHVARPRGKLGPVELTRRALVREAERLEVEVRRGLGVLATVGSVAPFVGLLGTVVGIIDAFQGIAKEGSGGLGAVSGGIAESLVVTALGLLVAIPAVFAFNLLNTRADALLLALDQARGELVDHLEDSPEPGSRAAPEADAPRSVEAPLLRVEAVRRA